MAVDSKCQIMNFSSRLLSYFRSGLIAFFLSVSFLVNAQELPVIKAGKVDAAVEKLMQLGREAVNAGRLGEALSAFSEVTKLDKNNPDAYFQLALIHFRRKDYVNGIDYIKRTVELLPDNPMPRMAYAKALVEVDQLDQAAKQYQLIMKKAKPGSKFAIQADLRLGVLLFERAEKNKNKTQLAKIGGQLILRHPKEAAMLHQVGSTLARSGLLKEAEATYIKLVKLMPANPMAEFYLASVYDAMRNMDAAERHLQLALKKGPNPLIEKKAKVKLGLIRGFRLMDRGDKEFALQEYQGVQELEPSNVIANSTIGNLAYRLERFDVAIDAFSRVLVSEPNNLDARMRLATIYLDQRNWLAAVKELDVVVEKGSGTKASDVAAKMLAGVDSQVGGRVNVIRELVKERDYYLAMLRQDPNNAMAHAGMGEVFLKQGKVKEAKKAFQEALRLDPVLLGALARLGEISDKEGDLQAAVGYFEKVLSLVEDDKKEKYKLRLLLLEARLFVDDNELERAEQMFMSALSIDEKNGTALWGLATLYSQKDNKEKALEWYQKVVEHYPNHLGAYLNMGLVYEELEDEGEALRLYRKVIQSEVKNDRIKVIAEQRISQVQREINGLGYVLGYSMGINDNVNTAQTGTRLEYRSDLTALVTYNYKIKKGLKFSLNFSPTYSIYHAGQYDFLNINWSPSIMFDWYGFDWNLGMDRSTQSSVIKPEQSSTRTDVLRGSMGWMGDDDVYYQLRSTYQGFGSQQNPFFDAVTVVWGINASRRGKNNSSVSYGYNFTINRNKNVLGSDYAYVAHAVNGSLNKFIRDKLSGYISTRLSLYNYSNYDSYSRFTKKRKTLNLGLGGGLNYRFNDIASFYVNYNYTIQYASLPIGFVLNEVQAIEGLQGSSLGGYEGNTATVGVRLRF